MRSFTINKKVYRRRKFYHLCYSTYFWGWPSYLGHQCIYFNTDSVLIRNQL